MSTINIAKYITYVHATLEILNYERYCDMNVILRLCNMRINTLITLRKRDIFESLQIINRN